MEISSKVTTLPQLDIGFESFSIASLSANAKSSIAYLANKPDLIDQLAVDREVVWQECESLFGKFSDVDISTLNKLYELFVAPNSYTVIPAGTTQITPFNCWVGSDCPSNR